MMFLRHDPIRWEQARMAVHLFSPDIPAWTSRITADGTRLASVPEKTVYDMLSEIQTKEISIVAHPRFKNLFEADFGLAHGPGPTTDSLEVSGMLQRAAQVGEASENRGRLGLPAGSAARDWMGRRGKMRQGVLVMDILPLIIKASTIAQDVPRLEAEAAERGVSLLARLPRQPNVSGRLRRLLEQQPARLKGLDGDDLVNAIAKVIGWRGHELSPDLLQLTLLAARLGGMSASIRVGLLAMEELRSRTASPKARLP